SGLFPNTWSLPLARNRIIAGFIKLSTIKMQRPPSQPLPHNKNGRQEV
ncbi:30600_t:CDS:1, partial [Racocetra persica]